MKNLLVLLLLLALSGCSLFSKEEKELNSEEENQTVEDSGYQVELPEPKTILNSNEESTTTQTADEQASKPAPAVAEEPAAEPTPAPTVADEQTSEPTSASTDEQASELAPAVADEPAVEPTSASTDEQVSEPVDSVEALAPVSFNLSASNFAFSQSSLTVKEGQDVTITLNVTEGFHDIKADGLFQSEASGEGTVQTVSFKAPAKGTYEYYCSIGSHRSMGMVGTLVVE